jgi:hypothetical protein
MGCSPLERYRAGPDVGRHGMALIEMHDGKPVPTTKVHFGFTDGISMTTIRGGPERYKPDHQQPCEPWLFVLLDEVENYIVPEPKELGRNGSFAVFKMTRTDVVGFENFLQSNKERIDPELLAAKMCGRWPNGVPLALSPDTGGRRRDAGFWIENASVEWQESQAPSHTVARLTLLPRSKLGQDASESLYFDVTGNSTPDSTPLGSINRARWPAEMASRKARIGRLPDLSDPARTSLRTGSRSS